VGFLQTMLANVLQASVLAVGVALAGKSRKLGAPFLHLLWLLVLAKLLMPPLAVHSLGLSAACSMARDLVCARIAGSASAAEGDIDRALPDQEAPPNPPDVRPVAKPSAELLKDPAGTGESDPMLAAYAEQPGAMPEASDPSDPITVPKRGAATLWGGGPHVPPASAILQPIDGEVADGARADLIHGRVVKDHDVAVAGGLDVQFDEVRAGPGGLPEGDERVVGVFAGQSAMGDVEYLFGHGSGSGLGL